MHQFVWARALCGTRIWCCASVDCSGIIRKIHGRKIRQAQARMHAIMLDFGIWGCLTRPRGPFRAQGSALTRNVERSYGSKNLLQRGILYRHETILLRQGRLQVRPALTVPSGGQPNPALRAFNIACQLKRM